MERYEQLKKWLTDHLHIKEFEITPASSDASFRRYFRVKFDGQSMIVMDAPPAQENTKPYIHIATLLADMGLNVPLIKEADNEQGYLLISDLGSKQYLDELNDDNADQLYADAMQSLLLMQQFGPRQANLLPPYDQKLLLQEMELFTTWYLKGLLGLDLSASEEHDLNTVFTVLAQSALSQPQVCVHRDYHSRNLMLTSTHNPGILDFQDAVIGPITYDLVSLLRDCYIKWPSEKVESWALAYKTNAIKAGVMNTVEDDVFIKWFDLMGTQRHLKATGIFARLKLRDNKPAYLNDIPRTLSYVVEVCAKYEELHALRQLILTKVPEYIEGNVA